MKVAIYASAFYPSLGGVEELVRQLAHSQQRAGHSPLVLTNRWPRSLPSEEVYQTVPVHRFPMRTPDSSVKAHLTYWLTRNRIGREMLTFLRESAPDLLHVQCVSPGVHYALLAKQALGLPLVVTLQGELTMDASRLYQRSEFARRVMRRALAEADAITACSGQTLSEAEAFFGRPFGDRARVVYNGIRLADFTEAQPFQHHRPYVLAIGRHVPQKGFDVLLQAFARVLASGEESHDLILAGDGDEHANLMRLAETLGVAERVRFTGRMSRPEATSLFLGCSFFVLPSRHEPLGIVNLEAMAAGKAVIASRVGGVPEIVQDGETGLLVPGGDVSALAVALNEVIGRPELRERMGREGRKRAERFDWDPIEAEYASVYEAARGAAGRRNARTAAAC